MNKDLIEKSLKARTELYKMNIVLIIGLSTGISGLLLQNELKGTIFLVLLIISIIFLIFVIGISMKSYIKITNLIKELES